MKTNILVVILLVFLSHELFAGDGRTLARKYGLNPTSKISIQWKRFFKRKKKMKKYGIDKLTKNEQDVLKKYLIEHAADSDTPEAAGL